MIEQTLSWLSAHALEIIIVFSIVTLERHFVYIRTSLGVMVSRLPDIADEMKRNEFIDSVDSAICDVKDNTRNLCDMESYLYSLKVDSEFLRKDLRESLDQIATELFHIRMTLERLEEIQLRPR